MNEFSFLMGSPLEDEEKKVQKELTAPINSSVPSMLPAAPKNEFADVMKEGAQDEMNRISGAIYAAKDTNPDVYAQAEAVAKKYGLPLDMALRNKDDLGKDNRLKDFQAVLSKSPKLRDWALSDPRNLSLANPDELDKISGLDWLFQSASQSYQSGVDQHELAGIRYNQMFGKATPQEIAHADYLSRKDAGRTFGADGWFESAWVGAANQAAIMGGLFYKSVEGSAEGAAVGATAALAAGQLGPQVATPEEIVTVPAGAAVGWTTGAALWQFKGSFELQTALAYDEYINYRDKDGNPLDPDVARVAALVSGSAGALLETYGVKKTLGQIPGMDKVMGWVGRDSVKAALKNPTVFNAFKKLGAGLATGAGAEIGTEILQETIQMAMGELAKSSSGQDIAPATPEEMANRVAQTAVQTAQVMALLGPITSGSRFLKDFSDARKAKKVEEVLKKVAESAKDNKLVGRDPAVAASAVDQVVKGSGVEKVYIPADKLVELFQNEDAETDAYKYGIKIDKWEERLNEAIATGGDVALTMGEYYANVAPSPEAEKIAAISKFDPLAFTPDEARKFNETMDETVAKFGEEAKKAVVSFDPTAPIEQEVKLKAQEAGVSDTAAKIYGTLYKEFFKTMGERAGQDPVELFKKFNLQIQQPDVMLSPLEGKTFTQGDKKVKGSITFADGGTTIRMFKSQNLSTFIHESGHLFLEATRQLSEGDNVPEDLKKDWDILKQHLGFDKELTREAHEKFAKSFEAYLMEGKAPSSALRNLFQRVRSWLLAVYRSAKRLGVVLSPEIKGVMDRMLASDGAIQEQALQAEFKPMKFDEKDLAPSEWAAYNDAVNKFVARGKDDLQQKMISELAASKRKEMSTALKDARVEAKEKLKNHIIYKTIDYLRNGREGIPHYKLDPVAIKEQFGEAVLGKMPNKTIGEGGLHPDLVAELMGWKSGSDMIRALSNAEPFNTAVANLAQQMVKEKWGDKFATAEGIANEASQSLHSNAREFVLSTELKALYKRGGKDPSSAPVKHLKNAAEKAIAGKTVKEVRQYKHFVQAERNTARKADEAWIAGDYEAAAGWKRKQIFSFHMAKMAKDVIKETDRMRAYAQRIAKRPPSIDPEYMDQIEALLEKYEFKNVSLNKLLKRDNLLQFIKKQEEQGNVTTISADLINDASKKNWQNMTVEEFRGLNDAVKNIEHLGKLKRTLTIKRKKLAYEQVRNEVLASVGSLEAKKKSANITPSKLNLVFENFQGADASLMKIEQLVSWLDQGDINGPMRKYIWQPIADAEVKRNDMLVDYTSKMAKIFEGVDHAHFNEIFTFPGSDYKFRRSDIYAVALNMGTFSNLDKMMRGEKWTDAMVETITSVLTKEDWDRVQQVWDVVNSMWTEIADLEKRLTGVAPEKVEHRPVSTKFGQYSGGYYPMIYDRRRDTTGKLVNQDAIDNGQVFPLSYIRPTTPHSHTFERNEKFAAPVSFDLNNAVNHLGKVIHDLTHREAVRDVYKLISDQQVNTAISNVLGQKYTDQFVPWLKAIAHDNTPDNGVQDLNYFIRKARMNATMVGIGFRISTIVAQSIGYVQAMEMVKPASIFKGMKMSLQDPVASWDFTREKSGEMRHRIDQIDRDIKDSIKALDRLDHHQAQIRRFAYYGLGIADRMVVVPVWIGAYQEHLAKFPNDEEGATAYADRAVRLTQGSGSVKDLAAVQRGGELFKLLTMYYSYFSALYNRTRNLTRDARRASVGDVPHLIARSTFLLLLPAVLGELVVGRGPDDEENPAVWALRKMLLYPFSGIPVVRDIVGGIEGGRGYTFTPAARGIESISTLVSSIKNLVEGDNDEASRKLVKSAIEIPGYLFGLPTGQVATTVNNIWRGLADDDLTLRDLFFARPKP